ncbi:phosphorylase [Hansschlegelia zhihuaiae]|nr:phosphorylase [Hansschlegelia zhihuaiae]
MMRGRGLVPVVGGGRATALEDELERRVTRFAPVAAILSSGLAGALDPSLKPGDVVVGHLVASADGGSSILERIRALLPQARVGPIVGSDVIVATVEEKRALHARTGAVAIDMESHIAARVAARHGLPFAALRTISDGADQELPTAALVGLRPDGRMAVGAVLASLARDPAQLSALMGAAIGAERAFRALLRSHDVLARAGIGGADPGQLPLDM